MSSAEEIDFAALSINSTVLYPESRLAYRQVLDAVSGFLNGCSLKKFKKDRDQLEWEQDKKWLTEEDNVEDLYSLSGCAETLRIMEGIDLNADAVRAWARRQVEVEKVVREPRARMVRLERLADARGEVAASA